MENDFFSILTGHAELIGLVPASRIFPVVYAQGSASPAIRYTKISGAPGLHMQGSDGLTSSIMQIDIRARVSDGQSDYGKVLAIRNVLVGKHGTDGLLHPFSGVKGETDFRLIRLRSDRGVSHDKTGAEEFYTSSLDFDVWSKAA